MCAKGKRTKAESSSISLPQKLQLFNSHFSRLSKNTGGVAKNKALLFLEVKSNLQAVGGAREEGIAEAESSAQHSEPLLVLTSRCFSFRDELGRQQMFQTAHHGLPCQQLRCYTEFSCLQMPRVLQSRGSVRAQGHGWGGPRVRGARASLPSAPVTFAGKEQSTSLAQRGMPRARLDRQSPLEGQNLGISLKNPWLRAPAHPRALGRQQQDLSRAGRGGGRGGNGIQAAAEPF